MNIMILKDTTEISITNGSDIYNIQSVIEDLTALGTLWDKLTVNNLSEVHIKDSEGALMGNYNNMVLCSPAFRSVDRTEDGKLKVTFGIRHRTELELLKEQVEAMKETLSVHDGAIGDMGAVISVVAEAQEGVTT